MHAVMKKQSCRMLSVIASGTFWNLMNDDLLAYVVPDPQLVEKRSRISRSSSGLGYSESLKRPAQSGSRVECILVPWVGAVAEVCKTKQTVAVQPNCLLVTVQYMEQLAVRNSVTANLTAALVLLGKFYSAPALLQSLGSKRETFSSDCLQSSSSSNNYHMINECVAWIISNELRQKRNSISAAFLAQVSDTVS